MVDRILGRGREAREGHEGRGDQAPDAQLAADLHHQPVALDVHLLEPARRGARVPNGGGGLEHHLGLPAGPAQRVRIADVPEGVLAGQAAQPVQFRQRVQVQGAHFPSRGGELPDDLEAQHAGPA